MHEKDQNEGPWIAGATFGIPRWFIIVTGVLVLFSWLGPGPTDGDVDPGTVSACSGWVRALNAITDGEQTDDLIVAQLRDVEAEAEASESAAVRGAAQTARDTFAAGDVDGFEAASAEFTQACENTLADAG